jgi:hypothetical protein
MNSRSSTPARPPRGTALIMTVIILSLITVLVLGFADMVRNETITSSSHIDRGRAEIFASMGVDLVQGILQKETADPARVWASRPGALIVPDESSSAPTKLARQIDLHSGQPASEDQAGSPYAPANLNIETLADQNPRTNLISDQLADPADPGAGPVKLRLKWIYVRRNGELDGAEVPAPNLQANPLVGRFAYWTDDESSKISLNSAWKRNPVAGSGSQAAINPFSPSHPTSINLTSIAGFTPEMADRLHAFITPSHKYDDMDVSGGVNRFFNSPMEPRVLGADFVTVLNAAKFDVTHYNHDPDTTFFNEPRIVLTTQKKHARGRPYLDILKNPGTETTLGDDPGYLNRQGGEVIDRAKLEKVVQKLVGYLKRTDWPMTHGSRSLQDKYFSGDKARLAQLALGIIEYVRCAESEKIFVEPIRLYNANGKYEMMEGSYAGLDDTFKGCARGLHITELAVWKAPVPTNGRYRTRFYVELHLPRQYGLDSVNLLEPEPGRQLYLYHEKAGSYYATANSTTTATQSNGGLAWFKVANNDGSTVMPTAILGGAPVMQAGDYRTIVMEFYCDAATTFTIRNGLGLGTSPVSANGSPRLELCPLALPSSALPKGVPLTYTSTTVPGMSQDITQTPPALLKSLETDDPRVNTIKQDWVLRTSGNSFNTQNGRCSVGKPPTLAATEPEQDTDEAGNVSDASLQLPYPKGHPKNRNGVVYSPGELGFISTGLEGKSRKADGSESARGGQSWRTLRLQPNRYANTDEVPDWAFMDLFTVPIDVPLQAKAMFSPHESSTAGRINVNSQVQPFGDPALVTTPMERRIPLVALLAGVPDPTPTDSNAVITTSRAQTIASNIYFRRLADKARAQGKTYGKADAYDSPGEVVEIKGVADGGEQSESVVRGIANLITCRGGVFAVYTVGQTLQESRSGNLRVTAEQRHLVVLERYSTGAVVKFRKVYSQTLTP